MVNVNFLNKAG